MELVCASLMLVRYQTVVGSSYYFSEGGTYFLRIALVIVLIIWYIYATETQETKLLTIVEKFFLVYEMVNVVLSSSGEMRST